MKCNTCNTGLINTYETFKDHGDTYAHYMCPWCGNESYQLIKAKKHKHNKTKVIDTIAMILTSFGVFSITFYILVHLDKFSTIYK